MVVSDDPDAVGLDPDVGGLDPHAVGLDPAADVGLGADGRVEYSFPNWNDFWCGIEDDDCDGKYKVDPDLDPVEADDNCDGKYKEADEDEVHKGGRQERHFLLSLLVCSAFGLK